MKHVDVVAYREILHVAREQQANSAIELIERFNDHWDNLGDPALYYVTSDMTTVASAAAKTMPSQPLFATDLPSSEGLCVWEAPITYVPSGPGDDDEWVPISAASWETSTYFECCDECGDYDEESPEWKTHWALPHETGTSVEIMLYAAPVPKWGGILPVATASWSIGEEPDPVWDFASIAFCDDDQAARTVRATWTLMAQVLARTEVRSPDRATVRRQIRAGQVPSQIVVVMLRRFDSRYDDNGDERNVHWTHRWVVSGHWRNQYLPSVRAHRLQWIPAYVKGNGPLIVKERITVLGR